MDNPALRVRGQNIRIVHYDGSAATVNGVVGLADTSAGEAGQPFGDFGPRAWIDFDGDRLHRHVTKSERVGTIYPTVKLNMSVEAIVMPHLAQFSGQDFNARDFATD